MDPIVNKSEVGGGNKNNANVNSEQSSVHPSPGRRSPTSSPASQRQKQSRGGQKQAQRGAAKSRRSSDSNNEDEKSSSGSSSYLQSNEGLQDQMTALFTDVQTMFNDVQVSLGARRGNCRPAGVNCVNAICFGVFSSFCPSYFHGSQQQARQWRSFSKCLVWW